MTWLDFALGALLLVAFWRGWVRGLIGALMGLGSLIAALLITRLFARPALAWLDERYGWLADTREALHTAAVPVIGSVAGDQWDVLPAANRLLVETYDRLAQTIFTVLFALVLFALITAALRFLAKQVTIGLDGTPLALPNRLLGAALNLLVTGSVTGIVCAVLLSVPSVKWAALTESQLAPWLAAAAKTLVGTVLGILQANGAV